MGLIAPSKFVPKGQVLYLEAFTQTGSQARTINQPLIADKTFKLLKTIPFAYGIDDRFFDGAHVHIKEIALKYGKNVKSSFNTEYAKELTLYSGSMFDAAVESVSLKVSLGDEEDEDAVTYGVSLTLPWADFCLTLPDYWQGCVEEWDKQLAIDYQTRQLNLLEDIDKDIQGFSLTTQQAIKTLTVIEGGADNLGTPLPLDVAAYFYNQEDLIGTRGPLTGASLEARQLKLIRKGIAVPKDDTDPPFGFQ
jgi:hypothetical protein